MNDTAKYIVELIEEGCEIYMYYFEDGERARVTFNQLEEKPFWIDEETRIQVVNTGLHLRHVSLEGMHGYCYNF